MRGRSTREPDSRADRLKWKKRELIVQCSQAADDDNKKIYRLTSIEKTVENVRSLAIHIKSHENLKGLTKNRMLQKPNAIEAQKTTDSYNEVQKVDEGEKVSKQYWQQADDAHDVAEAKKT